ncbi:nucleotidyltransferase family protein [Methyloceanibacter sp.]|uniref:nucleotidyltransferase family protein n=1 Tax=Methyloceanibacter sp. TaxID=1965321 RepID=UPI003D6DA0F4
MRATPRSSSGGVGLKAAAIVLAAGRSSRMAPHNKLLEPIDGMPIVRRVAAAALASGARPVVVVTGFEAPRVAEALRDLRATIVHNAAYAEGMSTSLRTGLVALPADSDGALILLGDMPEVEGQVLGALMTVFAATGRRAICVPARNGRRGNPVLWGAAYFAEMMTISGDIGAKQLMARHQEHVTEVAVGSDGIFADVDTPSDLARIETRTGSNP